MSDLCDDDNPIDTVDERELRLRELARTWDRYREASDPVSAAFVLTDFSNQMTHLGWQLEYEEERVEKEVLEAHSLPPAYEAIEVVVANYRVAWSEEDVEFVATVDEYPSLSWVAPTPQEALAGIIDLVEQIVGERAETKILPVKDSQQGSVQLVGDVSADAPELAGEDVRKVSRILWNHRPDTGEMWGGDIDEIVCHDATVHVEQMDEGCWWIGVYGDENQRWSGNFAIGEDGKLRFSQQDSEWEWDLDQSRDSRE